MAQASLQQSYLSAHARGMDDLAGGSVGWLKRLRAEGLARFREIGFPKLSDEDWKYTSVRAIEKLDLSPAMPHGNGVAAAAMSPFSITGLDSHRIVFVNGYFSKTLSQPGPPTPGLTVGSLAEVLEHDPDAVEPYLGRITPSAPHGFTALNSAFLADGAYVKLAQGVRVERPIEVVYVATGGNEELSIHPRSLFVAHPDSRATVVERYVALDDSRYLTNAVTEIVLEEGASLEHCRLQEEGKRSFHIGGLFARQEAGSRLTAHSLSLGAALARNDVLLVLEAERAEGVLNGLYLGNGRQHVDNHTHIEHAAADATSREFYKGILDGRARAVFHGRIVVRAGAQHSDAQQQNNNLLLSADAEIDTKPQLEIYADDVKCAHGATVGQLDADQVFYLQSRGVAKKDARSLLTYAFAHDVIGRIAVVPVRERLEAVLSDQLLTSTGISGGA